MKTLPGPMDVMKTMHKYIADAYRELPLREKGIIQFCLTENKEKVNCYFAADGTELKFNEGISETFDVRLEASLSDWLALAGKRLNPVLGIMTQRLKFRGNVNCFKKIIPDDLYKVNLEPFSDPVTSFEISPVSGWKRPERVLLIDSSPRGMKGYTKLYCESIEEFIKEKNIEIKHIVLSQYNIQRCMGCLQCWLKNEGKCILKDDVKELYDMYEDAELIIYAFPVYAYSVPGMLKNFMDRGVMRQYPYFEEGVSEIRHPRRVKTNKSIVVFSICGFPGFHQFDSVKQLFKLYSHSSHSALIAEIYRPGAIFLLQNPFNYMNLKNFLNALRSSVFEIIEDGKIKPRTKRKLNIKIDKNAFLESTNKYWDNLYKSSNANY